MSCSSSDHFYTFEMELHILSLRTQSDSYQAMATAFNEAYPSPHRSTAAIRQKYKSLLQTIPQLLPAIDKENEGEIYSRNLIIRDFLGGITFIAVGHKKLHFKEDECTIPVVFSAVPWSLGYDGTNKLHSLCLFDTSTGASIRVRHEDGNYTLTKFIEEEILARKANGFPLMLTVSLAMR